MMEMDKDVFGIVVEQFVSEKLDEIMLQDSEYVNLQDEIWKEKEKCNQLGISESQHQMLEDLISLHIKNIELYSKKAYGQGFMDCVSLLQKIGVIRIG
ncbi:MAG: hypothetical protein HDR28_08000 [Lachnospiraceae bacterium]|nr:hypothetical protein [Lachnospiraceae bacterium]